MRAMCENRFCFIVEIVYQIAMNIIGFSLQNFSNSKNMRNVLYLVVERFLQSFLLLINCFYCNCYVLPSHISTLAWSNLYMGWSDVTESMVTIWSPFCGYNSAYCMELKGEDSWSYSHKIESVTLRKCPYDYYLTTHTHPFNGPFLGLPRWAGTRKGKPIWILLKHETVTGSGISWAMCKSAPRSRQITMPAPHHSSFFYRLDALPAAQPTVSKHWRFITLPIKSI